MRKKKLPSLLLALALLLVCLPVPARAGSDYELTGQGEDDIVSVARSRLGRTGRELGYTYEWCACFVTWAGRTAGQDFPAEDLYTPMDVARYFAGGDRGRFYCFRKGTYDSLVQGERSGLDAAVLTTRAGVTPKKGDLVCFLWPKDIEEGYNWSHIGILTQDYDGGGMLTTIEGNTGTLDTPQSRCVGIQSRPYNETVVGIIRPEYSSRGREVRHYLEQEGGRYVLAETETVSPAGKDFTLEDALSVIRTYDTHAYPDLEQILASIQAEGPLELYYPRLYALVVIPGDGVDQVSGAGLYTAGTEVSVTVQAAPGSVLDWTDNTVRQKDGAVWTLVMPAWDALVGVSAKKPDCVEPFLDVAAGAWYAKYVARVHELGLIKGTAADAFSPERGLTLAEAVTLAARLHSSAAGNGADFSPAAGEPWYAPCAAYAAENGLIEGELDLRAAATRRDFARILGRALPPEELEPLWEDPAFADMEGETPEEIALLYRAGVLSGETADGARHFRPERPISRAEAAAVMARMADPALRLRPEGNG